MLFFSVIFDNENENEKIWKIQNEKFATTTAQFWLAANANAAERRRMCESTVGEVNFRWG